MSRAAQAMSACDRLEQGVKDGDPESIAAVREMIVHFRENIGEGDNLFSRAFMAIMARCEDGDEMDLSVAMMAIRCLTEVELKKAFSDGEDEDGDESGLAS